MTFSLCYPHSSCFHLFSFSSQRTSVFSCLTRISLLCRPPQNPPANGVYVQCRYTHKDAGASRMRWFWQKKYKRCDPSNFFAFPPLSVVTKKVINWRESQPSSGYEALKFLGPNTLELRGIPFGKTPEYMQERLRRFFSKFGLIKNCICLPHRLDPYQCEDLAYISFRSKYACFKALKAPLVFPVSLHSKIVHMKMLDNDKENDPQFLHKAKHYNKEIISICTQLYFQIYREGNSKKLSEIARSIKETDFSTGKICSADLCVYMRFGSWKNLLLSKPFDEIFFLNESEKEEEKKEEERKEEEKEEATQNVKQLKNEIRDEKIILENNGAEHRKNEKKKKKETYVQIRIKSIENFNIWKRKAEISLQQKLDDELSVHWRTDKIPLPAYVQQRVNAWQHKDKLCEELQILSRSKDVYKIHDERHLFKLRLKRERNKLKKEIKQQQKAAELANALNSGGDTTYSNSQKNKKKKSIIRY